MNQKRESNHIIDTLFVFALFLIFAICALVLVTIGANVYQKTVDDMNLNYNSRTAFSYVTEKIRQNDEYGGVAITQADGVYAIVLTKVIDDKTYNTYLYEHDGFLKELFIGEDLTFEKKMFNAGQSLIPIKDFSLETVKNNLIRFNITSEDGESLTLYISPKSERGKS